MPRLLSLIGAPLASLVLLAGCSQAAASPGSTSSPQPSASAPAAVPRLVWQLGPADAGRTIAVAVGAEIDIVLPANPTTGYAWMVVRSPGPVVLAVAGPAGGIYHSSASASGLVGAGGTESWTFRAVGAGTTTIALGYERPWESGVPPAQGFTLTVTVG